MRSIRYFVPGDMMVREGYYNSEVVQRLETFFHSLEESGLVSPPRQVSIEGEEVFGYFERSIDDNLVFDWISPTIVGGRGRLLAIVYDYEGRGKIVQEAVAYSIGGYSLLCGIANLPGQPLPFYHPSLL